MNDPKVSAIVFIDVVYAFRQLEVTTMEREILKDSESVRFDKRIFTFSPQVKFVINEIIGLLLIFQYFLSR